MQAILERLAGLQICIVKLRLCVIVQDVDRSRMDLLPFARFSMLNRAE